MTGCSSFRLLVADDGYSNREKKKEKHIINIMSRVHKYNRTDKRDKNVANKPTTFIGHSYRETSVLTWSSLVSYFHDLFIKENLLNTFYFFQRQVNRKVEQMSVKTATLCFNTVNSIFAKMGKKLICMKLAYYNIKES